jgi:hypothetical protein
MLVNAYISRTYTHVWSLGKDDNFVSQEPRWGWVALGPRGHMAGAEHTAEQAKHCAQAAVFLLEAPKRP